MGDTLALCPPLIVTEAHVAAILERMGRTLERTEAWIRQEAVT
ncbi:hypothetical protein ACFQXB_00005 [Plastorhodobacter daqingensis]|uniref:Uncharacterized protein n=1 Tax=Plastorhodobacter daqingensis TaxID=1387281 RepID=A0ABW2UDD5_9RHOB